MPNALIMIMKNDRIIIIKVRAIPAIGPNLLSLVNNHFINLKVKLEAKA